MRILQFLTCGVVEASGHHFIGSPLGRQAVVLDLGANIGAFSEIIKLRWGARCIAVEANPDLCKALKGPDQVIHAAIAGASGETDFFIEENLEASSIYGRDDTASKNGIRIRALTLEALMRDAKIEQADLVKIDIEGAEVEVLLAASEDTLKGLGQITVEFHDFGLPRVSPTDVMRVKERLHAAGFWSVSFSRLSTDVLFINKSAGILNSLEYYWLAHAVRNLLGLARVTRRWLHGGLSRQIEPA